MQIFIPRRRRAAGSSLVDPLDDPDIWAFWRSDMNVHYDSGNNNQIKGPTYSLPRGWHDTTSNDRFLQPTAAENGPQVQLNDVNGKPSILFNRTLNNLYSGASFTLAQPYTIFFGINVDDIATNEYIIDGGAAQGALLTPVGNDNHTLYAGAYGPSIATVEDTWKILTTIWDGASSSIEQNNDGPATGNPGTASATSWVVNGYGGNPAVAKCIFKLAAIIITSVHSDSTWVTNHKNWLADYMGLSI